PVAVEVDPRGARGEVRVGDAGPRRHVAERAVAVVTKQVVGAERREIQVWVTVIIVVARGDPHTITVDRQAGAARHLLKRPIAPVAVECREEGAFLLESGKT